MKKIKLFFFIFVLSSNFAFASSVDLSEHGKELMKASFPTRYAFTKKYHKDWIKSTYDQRKEFLTEWYINLAREEKKNREIAKEESRLEREKAKQKKAEVKAKEQRIKARARQEKAEIKEDRNKTKDFNKKIKANQRALNQMHR